VVLSKVSTNSKTSLMSSRRVGRAAMHESVLRVAKNDSATALTEAQPVEPIETAMPASRAFWPKPSEGLDYAFELLSGWAGRARARITASNFLADGM